MCSQRFLKKNDNFIWLGWIPRSLLFSCGFDSVSDAEPHGIKILARFPGNPALEILIKNPRNSSYIYSPKSKWSKVTGLILKWEFYTGCQNDIFRVTFQFCITYTLCILVIVF